ncbi:MAG: AAA family ATPase [Candidatus Improbicoccus devescovinae]|nr:MAG: AAA family ATPase [Candidatus Improbicoccus devescovinae]
MAGTIILGANGSGKSTIGCELARVLNCVHFETEDYWFHKTEKPYTVSRKPIERNEMLLCDCRKYDSYVVSGDVLNWNKEFLKLFDFAVFLEVPTSIRIERIKNREHERFGDRVCKGGDMYEQHLKFIEYASSRDVPLLKEKAVKYNCPVVYVDGTESCSEIIKKIKEKAKWQH